MANRERVLQAIAIMERAGVVDMSDFRSEYGPGCDTMTEADLHRCGTAACFAGWVAVAPEFLAAGGECIGGMPISPFESSCDGADAIAWWLDISHEAAHDLVFGGAYNRPDLSTWLKDITREDVIAALRKLL